MTYHHLVQTICVAVCILLSGCAEMKRKEKQISSTTDSNRNKSLLEINEPVVSNQTTDNLCQVAQFLETQNFNGDFYVYDSNVKWGMDVDSVELSKEIINQLISENIEYVARARGVIEFEFYPTKSGEHGLLLNTEPANPLITSGNVEPKFTKLDNPRCLDFDWYYQTYK